MSVSKSNVKEKDFGTDKRELSPAMQRYISYYQEVVSFERRETVSPIHVDELASKVAKIYEKVRRIIDWKEEHLVRRTAIERALKRRMISKIPGFNLVMGLDATKMAEPLVMELIRGGYFENDKISKVKIPNIEKVLLKHIYILENASPLRSNSPLAIKGQVQFFTWIVEIAACEIDEILAPPLREIALLNLMTNTIAQRIRIIPDNKANITENEKLVQTYIAVHRTLFNLDTPIISYNLIKYCYPGWGTISEPALRMFTEKVSLIQKNIERDLSHKYASAFFRICEKYDAAFLVLGDVLAKISTTKSSVLDKVSSPDELKDLIKEVYEKRLSTLKSRLLRAANYSTLSIFLAGSISLFIIEVPIAKLFLGRFSLLAMFVDIMLPTVFMFILVALIRPPSKKNFERVVEEINKIVYADVSGEAYELFLNKRRRFLLNFIFGMIYFGAGILSMVFIFWVFKVAHVPWTSLYIDTANIAVIIFAAMVIKQRAKELTIEEDTTFGESLIDVFSIPIAKLGQWFASKWKEYNFVSVFFTALVDMPFSTFIEIIEEWRSYIKDRKAGIH